VLNPAKRLTVADCSPGNGHEDKLGGEAWEAKLDGWLMLEASESLKLLLPCWGGSA
jgi:hypothetical protein